MLRPPGKIRIVILVFAVLICGWLASARPSKEPAMELLSRDAAIIESESRANSNSFGAGLVQLKQLLAEKSPGQVNSAQDLGNADRTAMSQEIAARLSDLPSGCLSGLEGLDLTGIPKVDIDAETARIRRIVEGNRDHTVSNRPSEFDGHSIPARPIRSLPDVNEVDRPGEPTIQTTSFETPYNPHANATETSSGDGALDAISRLYAADGRDPHADVFQESMFPSATQCAKCHEQIYDEWASSGHAYASISPMFTRFEDTINELSQGTIGYFCLRCHAPVATTVGLRRDQPIWDGPRVLREGVTCIVCHRVKENYTKANGERRIEPGDMFDPVYSGSGEIGTQVAAKYKDFFKVKTSPGDSGPGQPLHNRAIEFEQLSQSDFCMSCHQVAVQPGIKLEVVWDQYRASPAYRDGTTCQDCHMGVVPGRAEGYSIGPAAVVDGKVVTAERKHSNHMFFGPGYSVAHPGVFPQNEKADRWAFNDWLLFDWRAGWGTEQFENAVASGQIRPYFPPAWAEADDRYDARDLINANLAKLNYKTETRRQVMENGSKIDGPFFQGSPVAGVALRFHYCVTNTNPGHNMPSGSLGAQPQLWLNVVLIDPDGNRVWESGYLDSIGDLADLHSDDVLNRRVPLDKQLFNLQTKFLTSNVKGTDREMYLPINLDIDQLPFIRPAPQPVTVLNHPPSIRMEAHSIPPLGSRKAKYVVPADLIQRPGTWRLSVRMRSRAEPIYFMKFVKSTPEMMRMMNEGIMDIHVQSVVFEVK